MRLRIKHKFVLLLTLAAVFAAQAAAQASSGQSVPASDKPLRAELALGYTYLRRNAPPGGCGCFNVNGRSAIFA